MQVRDVSVEEANLIDRARAMSMPTSVARSAKAHAM
jgi:hypothetical protein